ncbi:fasciclin domain-containing protein [Mucilaginibacter sp. cycad4]|uniref:fasciclin domain-containing protein n=1 Tax=Mucilaginibacter sp. cycad4 TaxID=3342096 RepID=UPI002AABE799|nr:fasciclin domain-containing protein [Mucilaginibacter gossypii]WPV01237.1 fasciclin domain-containing protein [Mucilaginibacter gossypii]
MKKLLLFTLTIFYPAILLAQTENKSSNTTGATMLPTNDIVKNISLAPNTHTFYIFIQKTDLSRTYTSRGPITIFVPVDDGYNNMPAGKFDSLAKPAHIWELTDLVTYHAIAGQFKAKDIQKRINRGKGMAIFTTLSGGKLFAKIDSNSNIVLIDGSGGKSTISQFDIKQNNGIVHLVNKVLIPKKKLI